MGSRIRDDVSNIFLCFCEVARPENPTSSAWIIQKYPDSFSEDQVLDSVPKFTYPCPIENTQIQYFSFVLTNVDSKWTFGFCRHNPDSPTAFVFLSYLPWYEFFMKALDQVAELIRSTEVRDLTSFLDRLLGISVPKPGLTVSIPLKDNKTFSCPTPDPFKLPSIPESRIINEYYNAVDINNMLIIFASILYERRIIITSTKLHRLTACVQAANTLIYPMHWQHIFIPVLPSHLTDYLLAPMPFLIGVPTATWEVVKKSEIGDYVVLDADLNDLKTPFRDLDALPQEVVKFLKSQLRNRAALLGEGFARTFLKALVQLIGGYRDALRFQHGQKITFNEEKFIETRPSSMQPFLRDMLRLQLFQQFIEERLYLLNNGLGFSDEFEFESCRYMEKSSSKIKAQYKEWVNDMKGRGVAFFKTVKNKTNPAVKSAVKSVRDRGKDVKSAYRDIRSRMRKDGIRMRGEHVSGKTFDFSTSSAYSLNLERSQQFGENSPTMSYHRRTHAATSNNHKITEPVRQNSESLLLVNGAEEEIPIVPKLDIDLLGDLQEVINRQCTLLDKQQNSQSGRCSGSSQPDVPPVPDRTLKPVRSLDLYRPADYNTTDSSTTVRPLNPRRLSRTSSNHAPLSRTTNSLPISPTSGLNPFLFKNSNPSIPDLSPLNPFITDVPPSSTSQCNETGDLIRLDSEETNFDPISRDSSDDSIKFKTGLINPLYPFYTPNTMNTINNVLPSPNTSFLYGPSASKNSNFNKQDMDLLKEYGITFNSNDASSSNFDFDANAAKIDNPFDSLLPGTKTNAPGHWDTFD